MDGGVHVLVTGKGPQNKELVDLRHDVAKRAKDCEALRRDIHAMHKHLQLLGESKQQCVGLKNVIAGQQTRISDLRKELQRKQTAVKQQVCASGSTGLGNTKPCSAADTGIKQAWSPGSPTQRRRVPAHSAQSARFHTPRNSHARQDGAADEVTASIACDASTPLLSGSPRRAPLESQSRLAVNGSTSPDTLSRSSSVRLSQRKKAQSCSRHCLIAPFGEQSASDFGNRRSPPPPPVRSMRQRTSDSTNGHVRKSQAASWDSIRPSTRSPRSSLGKGQGPDSSPKSASDSPKSNAWMMGSWSPPPSPAKSGVRRMYNDMEDIESNGLDQATESNGDSHDVTHPVLGRLMEELDHQTELLNTVFGPVPQKSLRRSKRQASALRSNSESDLQVRTHASFDGVPRRSISSSARSQVC
mmetsp:Transcript_1404/g.3813  ORF Transcript_1404/g.3813 Transcript_1404/m.3813 type:complete len:414 (-) Transcript_1404:175-1416(-)